MRHALLSVLVLLGFAASAAPQEPQSRLAVDFSGGYAAFVDESAIEHLALGAGVRWQLTPKVSVGPDFVFMRGPDDDRDFFLTGKLMVDFMPDRAVSPFVVADGGAMFHRDEFVTGSFWAKEGAASGGGGVRINVSPRVSIAPEFRIGWETHFRIGATLIWRP
jgi:hypothetical protein